ncbi:MAG: SDR family oxidoreductase [Bacteroidaceae bacterium]|nr:SDR family oxidoreductase [Bacteroidaceae bacterium]
MKKALVVGGANGIGLAIARELAQRAGMERVTVVDKAPVAPEHLLPGMESLLLDLASDDYSVLDRVTDIDTLVITAGFGKLALFRDVTEEHITTSFQVNTVAALRILKRYYPLMESRDDFYCGVMVSIAGFMSSPFFAVYGATKAALKIFIESVNVELEKAGTSNRILNVSPGSIRGTSFSKGPTNLAMITTLAREIIGHLERKDDLFIPQFETVYQHVLERYHADFRAEGRHSYDYKLERLKSE